MTLALFFWPALACLVLLSLWRLADEMCGRQVAILTCLLCACVPALQVLILHTRTHTAFLNGIEVAAWLGLPLALLAASGMSEDLARLIRRRSLTAPSALALALMTALAVLATAGGAKAETARAWLIFVPVVGLVSAGQMPALFSVRRAPIVWAMLIVQLGTIYLVKVDRHFR